MADDIDGPSNNHIHFSIVKGNQAGPFTIDTVSGEVKVVCPLDREKVATNFPRSSHVPLIQQSTINTPIITV